MRGPRISFVSLHDCTYELGLGWGMGLGFQCRAGTCAILFGQKRCLSGPLVRDGSGLAINPTTEEPRITAPRYRCGGFVIRASRGPCASFHDFSSTW